MRITVDKVSKEFNHVPVLEESTLSFESGKIYGLIGRNGSGKSVFLKILCGFYKPTSGRILYDDEDLQARGLFPKSTRALIEKPSFIPDMTGLENLKLLSEIQNKIGIQEIEETLKKVNLYEARNKKFCTYSLGMKQKLGIAQVLMEDPEVMVFDEPLNGIESETAEKIRMILKEERKKGKLIIVASHIREDIEGLADVIYEFDGGKIKSKK